MTAEVSAKSGCHRCGAENCGRLQRALNGKRKSSVEDRECFRRENALLGKRLAGIEDETRGKEREVTAEEALNMAGVAFADLLETFPAKPLPGPSELFEIAFMVGFGAAKSRGA